MSSETIDIWNKVADLYAQYRPAPPAILRTICTQLVRMPRPRTVVDIGSGTGLSTVFWSGHAEKIIGVEPNDDMRKEAIAYTKTLPDAHGVEYRAGVGSSTGMPDESADIVTCSQSLHWMDPAPTFAEIARILRPGGVFVAYDYDVPPTVHWELDLAYRESDRRFHAMRKQRGHDRGFVMWEKSQHLARIEESGRFRAVKEILFHQETTGNAAEFIGFAASFGIARFIKNGHATEQDLAFDRLTELAHKWIGSEPAPWLFSYRARVGVK